MSNIVMNTNVVVGENYWAPWGNKGWSAVRVLSVSGETVTAERVNPKTGQALSKGCTTTLTKLAPREPGRNGADKPDCRPNDFVQRSSVTAGLGALADVTADPVVSDPSTEVVAEFAEQEDCESTCAHDSSKFEQLMKLLGDND